MAEGPAPIPEPLPESEPTSFIRRVILHVSDTIRTGTNRFGVLREYLHRPSYDPDHSVALEDLSERPPAESDDPSSTASPCPSSTSHAWSSKNLSTSLLMDWMSTGSNTKSQGEVDRLVKEVIRADGFKIEELADFNARAEYKHMDVADVEENAKSPFGGDGWLECGVSLSIPTGVKSDTEAGKSVVVPGLHYRPLVGSIMTALQDVAAARFHYSPFKRIWVTPSGQEQRCYDEVYTSDAHIEAHHTLQKQPNEEGCKLEKVVLALMFWSDSTHLTNFGTAKVWPLYMYFGNLTKYLRGKPGSASHVAYFPSVCEAI